MAERQPVKFVCVLRSGGDYDASYVFRLWRDFGLVGYDQDFEFHALSDIRINPHSRKLEHNWPGWWSQMEMWRIPGPAIYMDLDTVICGDLSPLVEWAQTPGTGIACLRNRRDQIATGIAAWQADAPTRDIYETFVKEWGSASMAPRGPARHAGKRLTNDEEFVAGTGLVTDTIKDVCPGVYSYKNDCKKGIPDDARVICFHGKPRPHEVGWLEKELACRAS